jgi:hypothetical protein
MKMSKNELLFSAEGGIDTVTSDKAIWTFGTHYWNGCERDSDTEKIECSWFSVEKVDEYTLIISVDKNENEEKKQRISVSDGPCYSGFLITQAPKQGKGELRFSAKGGIDSIATEMEWHYIEESIAIGNTRIYLVGKDADCLKDKPYIMDNVIGMCRADIPFFTSGDYYSSGIIGIEGPWFTIDKPNKKKVIFSVNENKTGKGREFGISLDAGDYFTDVWVNQLAE